MSVRSSWVVLKLHRFEVGAGTVFAMLAGVVGLHILIRLRDVGAPPECLAAALESATGTDLTAECRGIVRQLGEILGETYLSGQGPLAWSVMGVVPFVAGLLGGVPIVAREIEDRTAQTSWSLSGSRGLWLARQMLPIGLVLGLAVAFAALVSVPVAEVAVDLGRSGYSLIGTSGLIVIIRAVAAFMIGTATGALLGRSLPAFMVSVAVCAVLVAASSAGREAWVRSLPAEPIARYSATGAYDIHPHSILTRWDVLSPDGRQLTNAEARSIASAAGVPAASDAQDSEALEWYAENGFALIPVGVSDERAAQSWFIDAAVFAAAGTVALALTVVVVRRRRPS